MATTRPGQLFVEEGHWAEHALVRLLNSMEFRAVISTPAEDHRLKVDLWVKQNNGRGSNWIPIQLCTNRTMIAGAKGIDALHRGVIPSYVDGKLLERAIDGDQGVAEALVGEFWLRVERIMGSLKLQPLQPRRQLS